MHHCLASKPDISSEQRQDTVRSRYWKREMFETMLLPIGYNKEFLAKLPKIIEFAKTNKSKLIILSIVKPEESQQTKLDFLEKLASVAEEQARQAGLTADLMTRTGQPTLVICEVADELNVDVIAIGEKEALQNKGQTSTEEHVIEDAPCPVLVVP